MNKMLLILSNQSYKFVEFQTKEEEQCGLLVEIVSKKHKLYWDTICIQQEGKLGALSSNGRTMKYT